MFSNINTYCLTEPNAGSTELRTVWTAKISKFDDQRTRKGIWRFAMTCTIPRLNWFRFNKLNLSYFYNCQNFSKIWYLNLVYVTSDAIAMCWYLSSKNLKSAKKSNSWFMIFWHNCIKTRKCRKCKKFWSRTRCGQTPEQPWNAYSGFL